MIREVSWQKRSLEIAFDRNWDLSKEFDLPLYRGRSLFQSEARLGVLRFWRPLWVSFWFDTAIKKSALITGERRLIIYWSRPFNFTLLTLCRNDQSCVTPHTQSKSHHSFYRLGPVRPWLVQVQPGCACEPFEGCLPKENVSEQRHRQFKQNCHFKTWVKQFTDWGKCDWRWWFRHSKEIEVWHKRVQHWVPDFHAVAILQKVPNARQPSQMPDLLRVLPQTMYHSKRHFQENNLGLFRLLWNRKRTLDYWSQRKTASQERRASQKEAGGSSSKRGSSQETWGEGLGKERSETKSQRDSFTGKSCSRGTEANNFEIGPNEKTWETCFDPCWAWEDREVKNHQAPIPSVQQTLPRICWQKLDQISNRRLSNSQNARIAQFRSKR